MEKKEKHARTRRRGQKMRGKALCVALLAVLCSATCTFGNTAFAGSQVSPAHASESEVSPEGSAETPNDADAGTNPDTAADTDADADPEVPEEACTADENSDPAQAETGTEDTGEAETDTGTETPAGPGAREEESRSEDPLDPDEPEEPQEILETEGEEFLTDAVLETYIREHVDASLIPSVDGMDLVNGLIVKNTLMDGSALDPGDTLDSIMHGVEGNDISQFAKVLGQVETLVAVYDLCEDAAFYVASANTMAQDAVVRDYAFALYDNDGHVVDGCRYEYGTGLAYIPKNLYINADGDMEICRIQLQLMQAIGGNLEEMDSEVTASSSTGDAETVNVYRSAADIFSLKTTARVEAGLNESDMIVSVNGIPVSDYEYRPSTGEITLDQSAASIQSLAVITDGGGELSERSSSIAAYAASGQIADMEVSKSNVTLSLPAWATVGTGFSGRLPVAYWDDDIGYTGEGTYTYLYDFKDEGAISNDDLDALYNWVLNGSGKLSDGGSDKGRLILRNSYLLFKLMFGSSGYESAIRYDTTIMEGHGTANPTNGSAPTGADAVVDFSELGNVILSCGHVTTAANLLDAEGLPPEGGGERTVFIRLVWISDNEDEAVFAMLGGSDYPPAEGGFAQAGIGLIKIKVAFEQRTGVIEIEKSSDTPGISDGNDCYTCGNAAYGIYRDRSCKDLVETVTTDTSGHARSGELELGSYYVREIRRPGGYHLDEDGTVYGPVTLSSGAGSDPILVTLKVSDTPISDTAGIALYKIDQDTGLPSPQGGADLSGAEFTIRFYGGLYSESEIADMSPTRTWVVRTLESDGAHAALLDEEHWVSGDAWYYTREGSVCLPLGTYTIQETKAPAGYRIEGSFADTDGTRLDAGEIYYTQIRDDKSSRGEGIRLYGGNEFTQSDTVIRGGVQIQKRDLESGRAEPEGNASLSGAVFDIINANAYPVLVGGTLYGPGEAAVTLTTDEHGFAATEADALPYGTYQLTEAEAPDGYLTGSVALPAETERTFRIEQDGVIVDLTGAEESFTDQVKRGDVKFVKQDGDSQASMGPVKFLLTSATTGESHVLWTDENGDFASSSGWIPHTQNTNAGTSFRDGIWFYGYADGEESGVEVDDRLGALPYDTYRLEELPCEANEGRVLIRTEFTVYRDVTEVGDLWGNVDLGTLDNYAADSPQIGTALVDEGTGEHFTAIREDGGILLVDRVTYHGLSAGHTYVLRGILMDRATGEALKDINGETVTAQSDPFTTWSGDGSIEVTFSFSPRELYGTDMVAYEYLYEVETDTLAAEHADIEDEGQTVALLSPAVKISSYTGGTRALPVRTGDVHRAAWCVVVICAALCVILAFFARRRKNQGS